MPKRSVWTEAALDVGAEISALRRAAEEKAKDVIPVGEEALEPRELRLRLQNSRAARESMVKRPGGLEELLSLFRERGNA